MAMTKKEIAAHAEELGLRDAELRQWALRAALVWSPPVKPDIPPPVFGLDALTKGFLFNAYCSEVKPSCSSSVSHDYGRNDRTSIQKPQALYSTKLLALRALRHEVAMQFANKLLLIDRQIASEQALVTI